MDNTNVSLLLRQCRGNHALALLNFLLLFIRIWRLCELLMYKRH